MTTTTTSETRKQFRARLRVAYRRGFEAQANAMVASDATPSFSDIGECRASGCEAVYAEALRDAARIVLHVKEYFALRRYAESLGIDLTESDEK